MSRINILENLNQRQFDINRYLCWIDNVENLLTVPLFNLSGEIVGYQQYNPNSSSKKQNNPKEGRYFTYLTQNKIGMWGLETINHLQFIFVQEGIFDACRLHNLGIPAVAILSADNKQALLNLKLTGKKLISIVDNDPAGIKLGRKVHQSILIQFENIKDIGDCSDEQIKVLLNFLKLKE